LPGVRLLVERLFLRWSRSGQVDGMWVGYLGDNEFPKVFERVEEALRLIKRHDPVRYARLLCDLDRIWVTLLPASRARYRHALRLCDLRPQRGDAPGRDRLGNRA
jgi:hypothetical protein